MGDVESASFEDLAFDTRLYHSIHNGKDTNCKDDF